MMSVHSALGAAVFVGVGATLFVDAWNLALRRAFGVASLSACLLGRWVGHMPSGIFRHRAIASAGEKPFECAIGLATHYGVGVMLAAAFALGVAPGWLLLPTLVPALAYGLATVVLPFFVMQPALGLGIASSAARRPARARLKSLSTHAAFGVGLYVFGLLANRLWIG
jgi:hypothetical protein